MMSGDLGILMKLNYKASKKGISLLILQQVEPAWNSHFWGPFTKVRRLSLMLLQLTGLLSCINHVDHKPQAGPPEAVRSTLETLWRLRPLGCGGVGVPSFR